LPANGALETVQQRACKDIMNSVLNVAKSALKVLILWWVVVHDKYKTALVSDPRHRIALVDFLRPESPRPAVFLLYQIKVNQTSNNRKRIRTDQN
jgi:hypothetical protein